MAVTAADIILIFYNYAYSSLVYIIEIQPDLTWVLVKCKKLFYKALYLKNSCINLNA